MKRFMLVLALIGVAGATYVATAPGSQTAGPTMAQFQALKNKVATLQARERLQGKLLAACMKYSVPIDRFGDYTNEPATYGFQYSDPAINSGTPFLRTALDKTGNDDPNALWITGGNYGCHQHLPGAMRKPVRVGH